MDDWVTVVLITVAVLAAGGLGFLFGADLGYRRGWLFGERSSAKRTRRQLELSEEIVAKVYERERRTIELAYASTPVPEPEPSPVPHDPDPGHRPHLTDAAVG